MAILGVLTVLSALAVVVANKPLNSALFLVLTLFFVAAHFALLGAHFVAVIQVIVYAGAIMVLVIFVIMLLGLQEDEDRRYLRSPLTLFLAVASGCFIGVLTFGLPHGLAPAASPPGGIADLSAQGVGNTAAFGSVLIEKFVFPFELTSVLLLASIIGAVVLAIEPKRPLPAGRGLRAKRQTEAEKNELVT